MQYLRRRGRKRGARVSARSGARRRARNALLSVGRGESHVGALGVAALEEARHRQVVVVPRGALVLPPPRHVRAAQRPAAARVCVLLSEGLDIDGVLEATHREHHGRRACDARALAFLRVGERVRRPAIVRLRLPDHEALHRVRRMAVNGASHGARFLRLTVDLRERRPVELVRETVRVPAARRARRQRALHHEGDAVFVRAVALVGLALPRDDVLTHQRRRLVVARRDRSGGTHSAPGRELH